MKNYLITLLLTGLFFSLTAQEKFDCGELAFSLKGVLKDGDKSSLVLEVSNFLHTGSLYNYPGFLLRDDSGKVIAKEKTNAYGIGSGFQTHYLVLEVDEIELPFSGTLELHGSFYGRQYCGFGVGFNYLNEIDRSDLKDKKMETAWNASGDKIVVECLACDESLITVKVETEKGGVVYEKELKMDTSHAILLKELGKGHHYISIWQEGHSHALDGKWVYLE